MLKAAESRRTTFGAIKVEETNPQFKLEAGKELKAGKSGDKRCDQYAVQLLCECNQYSLRKFKVDLSTLTGLTEELQCLAD